MRADIAKVIVERPRLGGKGTYSYERRRLHQMDHSSTDFDHTEPKATAKAWTRGNRATPKSLNENLAPLRRWLQKQVGRPWSKVHAELRALAKGGPVQFHIWQHARDYVETDTFLRGREVWADNKGHYYRIDVLEFGFSRHTMYVHPKTKLLCQPKVISRKRNKKIIKYPRIKIDETHQLHYLNGLWYLVTLSVHGIEFWQTSPLLRQFIDYWQPTFWLMPIRTFNSKTQRLEGNITPTLMLLFGANMMPVQKQQIGKRLLKHYGLTNGVAPEWLAQNPPK